MATTKIILSKEELREIYMHTLKNGAERRVWLHQLHILLDNIEAQGSDVLLVLRNLCVEGRFAQDLIRESLPDMSNLIHYSENFTQFLINFVSGNAENQLRVLGIINNINYRASDKAFHYFSLLLNNMLVNLEIKPLLLNKLQDYFKEAVQRIIISHHESFEALFWVLTKAVPSNLDWFFSILTEDYFTELMDFLCETIEAEDRLMDLDVTDLEFLCSKRQLRHPELRILAASSVRGAETPGVQKTLMAVYDTLWKNVQEKTYVTISLQILANIHDQNQEACEKAEQYLHILLNATKLDFEHKYSREWAVILIRTLTSMNPIISERIASLQPIKISKEGLNAEFTLDGNKQVVFKD
jgi:hypothetical protein